MAQKNADIWITQEDDGYGIDVVLENSDDIEVVLAGTSLFAPFGDLEPVIKDYLENPNDLTTIYVGNSQITINSYTHTQGIGSTQWNINHNLNRPGVIIQCFDNNKREIYAEIQHIDNNNSVARFGLLISGTAECR